MKFYLLIITLHTLLFFTACQEENLNSLTTETAVVEAYLIAGQAFDSIKISQSNSYSSNDSLVITLDNLDLSISDGNNTFSLESVGNGIYNYLNAQVQSGLSYSLEFEHLGKTVSAVTYVPEEKAAIASADEITMEKIELGTFPNLGEQPDPIEIQWDNSEGDYFYVVVQNIEDDPEVINELFEDRGIRFTFISEPQITDFYAIDPRREIQQFGMHQIIIFRVNPEYAALYETSGTTSTTITQPPTNVVNGLGLFTGLSSDTLFLNVIEN